MDTKASQNKTELLGQHCCNAQFREHGQCKTLEDDVAMCGHGKWCGHCPHKVVVSNKPEHGFMI